MKWLLVLAALLAFAAALYPAVRFTAAFQLFGPPVRDNQHGWLGPTPRGTQCVDDIGKVNYWRCEDVTVFQRHRFGCRLWLSANGLAEDG